MDLEVILRACWRRRWRLLACSVLGALAFAVVGNLLLSPKYASSTDLSIVGAFPTTDIDASANQVYTQQPDRYVATQVEILSSRAATTAVAEALHLPPPTVAKAIAVHQLGQSDVIRVTVTTGDPKRSARIADHLVDAYLASWTRQTNAQYQVAIDAVVAQQAALDEELATLRKNGATVPDSSSVDDAASGASPLAGLVSQEAALAVQRQHLEVQSKTAPTATKVVSRAAANPVPVGLSTRKLELYGAAIGLAIGLAWVTLTTGAGRTLDTLESAEEVDGIPVLGRTVWGGMGGPHRGGRPPDVATLRVAGEICRIIQLKGPVELLVSGPRRVVERCERTLVPVIRSIAQRQSDEDAPDDVVVVTALGDFLARGGASRGVIVAIDVVSVTPAELDDLLAAVRTFGADVLGIVQTR